MLYAWLSCYYGSLLLARKLEKWIVIGRRTLITIFIGLGLTALVVTPLESCHGSFISMNMIRERKHAMKMGKSVEINKLLMIKDIATFR